MYLHSLTVWPMDIVRLSGDPIIQDSLDGGCACFLVSRLEVAPDEGAGAVEVKDARGVHDEGRPAEKLVRANACRSCTSRSALQAR